MIRKVTIAATIAVALVTPAAALDDEDCALFSSVAEVMMTSRQSGMPMSSMMKAIEKSSELGELKNLVREMVIQAYKVPRYSTERYKRRMIEEFRDDVYLACVTRQENVDERE